MELLRKRVDVFSPSVDSASYFLSDICSSIKDNSNTGNALILQKNQASKIGSFTFSCKRTSKSFVCSAIFFRSLIARKRDCLSTIDVMAISSSKGFGTVLTLSGFFLSGTRHYPGKKDSGEHDSLCSNESE